MPGLIGTVAAVPDTGIDGAFERMLGPMQRSSRFRVETARDRQQQWALGRVHLGVLNPGTQLSESNELHVLFHGDLHNGQAIAKLLDLESGRPADARALVADLYARFGEDMGAHLEGAFCAAVLDRKHQQLLLISDLLGSYPLYWCHTPGRLTFASELKAVLRHPAVNRALDARSVADYLQFGFVFGERTLAEGISLLAPGSVLTYDSAKDACTVRQYRRVADLFKGAANGRPAEALDRLTVTFGRCVERARQGDVTVGLSLSGGLDTRAILSAIPQGHPVSSYTLGVRGCADEVIAERLSSRAGTKHSFFELDDRYLADFLPNLARMVSLTDGMYLSHGLTEILAVRFLENADFNVLLRGHCGELAKTNLAWPFHTDPHIATLTSPDQLASCLLQRLKYVVHGTSLPDLFHDGWAARMADGPRQSLMESMADVPLPPSELCSYLYLQEHHRRFTIPSLEMFRDVVEVRLPFADTEFLQVLFATSGALRAGTDIHRALIRKELARVRNSNTGAAADAGALMELVLDKFNTLFRRLNVYGYRHYHNFDAWMKQQLLESVESVLLDPITLGRGMLREATLRRLIQETRSGTADHGYLFQVLLLVELWQRENLT